MYTEFIAATLEAHGRIEEERIAEAFDRLDSDDSGYISKDNLRDFLGGDATTKQINEIIKESDKDKDGKRKLGCAPFGNSWYFSCIHLNVIFPPFAAVSYQDFLQLFRNKRKALVNEIEAMDTSGDSDSNSAGLVGLDAKIPGGKFDSTISDSLKKECAP
jgi:hypothetical protein